MPESGGTRLLQVITDTDRRGPQVFSVELESALAYRGHRVRTVALAPGRDRDGLPVQVLGRRRMSLTTLRNLRLEARANDVVIGHGSSTLPACSMALRGMDTTLIQRNIGEPLYWGSSRGRRARTRYWLRRADYVVALWDGAASELTAHFGVPGRTLHVIPRGAPADRFSPIGREERAGTRRRLDLHPSAPIVMFVGALAGEKRVDLAIRAVGMIQEATLVVVGEGPERRRLERLADSQAPGRVRFLGSTRDTAGVLGAADVVVLPSLTEGIPAILIEAGMSAVPVVATSVGGIPEVVEDGLTGRLVPPADLAALTGAIREVLRSGNEMGQRARARCIERFELGRVADRWDQLLRELQPGRESGRGKRAA